MREPPYSCPSFDAAIIEIEKARETNDDLRSWGKYWEEKAEGLEADLKTANAELDEANEKISELEKELGR